MHGRGFDLTRLTCWPLRRLSKGTRTGSKSSHFPLSWALSAPFKLLRELIMSQDDTLYREVDEELAQDQFLIDLKKQAPMLLTGVAIILAIVGGRQIWASMVANRNATGAEAYAAAEQLIASDTVGAAVAFEALSTGDHPGYAAMGLFRAASIHAIAGDIDQALMNFQQVAANDKLPSRVQNLAKIRAAHLSLAKDRTAAIAVLGGLETEASVMGAFAREVTGLAALAAKDYAAAELIFDAVASDPDATASLKQRAAEFGAVANMGANGVNLSPEGNATMGLEDLFSGASPTTVPELRDPELADIIEQGPAQTEDKTEN